MPGNQEPDFADLIERAQNASTDISSPYGTPSAGRVAFEPGKIRGATSFDYECKIAVLNLPDDSGEYEEIQNQALNGECVVKFEEKNWSKEGDFRIAICYLTPRARRPAAQPGGGEPGDQEPVAGPRRLA